MAVHQPVFLPYLGFFKKMQQADILILYDTAQYSKNEYHNRNRIKTPRGPTWLTVPVRSPRMVPISSVKIDNTRDWGRRLSLTLEANYAKAPWFRDYETEIERLLRQSRWERLADLNFRLVSLVANILDIDTETVRASSLPKGDSGDPTDKLIEMTRAVGGDTYLSGPGGHDYLDRSKFDRIALRFSSPAEVAYPQLWGPFEPNLSVVDAIFNCGAETKSLLA